MFRPSLAASYKPTHGGYPGVMPEAVKKIAALKAQLFAPPGSFGDGACGMALLRVDGEESPYSQTTEIAK